MLWLKLQTKRDKSVVFPSLCYQAKINELIFLIYFYNPKVPFPNQIGFEMVRATLRVALFFRLFAI